MIDNRIESLKERICELLTECSYPIGLIHLEGVAILCVVIGLKRELKTDICRCAGLLHDLWLYYRFPIPTDGDRELKKQHGYFGSDFAKEILLEKKEYTDDDIQNICRMIYHHNDKDVIHDVYSETLKDADAFWHYLNNSNYDKSYKYHGRVEKAANELAIFL